MYNDCINYSGHIGKAGYGLDYNPATKKTVLAHRYAYYMHYEHWPRGVCAHLCNNKKCINPFHLQDTTQSKNVKQSYKDGLQINPHRKCTQDQVIAIYITELSTRKLARLYGVTQKIVCNIKQGKTYKEWTGHGGSCGV